jgi:hypothetical protein
MFQKVLAQGDLAFGGNGESAHGKPRGFNPQYVRQKRLTIRGRPAEIKA